MTWQGRVENGLVVFQDGSGAAPLPDGTLVEVTPVRYEAGKTPGPVPVSKERQEALRQLIGIWKMDNSPNDEEVERINEEERMKKYG